jgi:hypothetical protein
MWMTGFQSVGDPGDPCVALLFPQWVLDTVPKFALGCCGVFLMGLCVEGLVKLRRWINQERLPTHSRRRWLFWAVMQLLLYGVQLTLGYFLMLIAMTYEVELFLMVITGLVLGHALFNLNGPVLESADACCAGQDPGLVEDASPGSPNRQVEPSGHCSERGCSGAPPLSDNYSNGITRSNSGKTLVEHPEDLNVQSCSSHAES